MIYEYNIDLFKKEAVQTEGTAYKLLKDNPIVNANYVAAPWSVLINHGGLNKLKVKKVKNGFTICQHISYQKIIPILKRIGVNVLFTPHAVNHSDMYVLPFPHLAVNSSLPKEKNILYSFIGFDTHSTRKEIFKLPKNNNIIIKQRNKWHFEIPVEKRIAQKKEYIDVLSRSRFSLCPRGTGPSTIRFWESLRSGSIPILISDAMRLPDMLEQAGCMIRVKEKEVKNINNVIKNIPLEIEETMRKKCLEVYNLYSGKNFVSCIRKFYA